jgi:uncharacterized protein YggE
VSSPCWLIVVAATAIVLLVPALATAQDRTISVTGTATLKVTNDAASVGLSVSKERRTRGAALRAVAIKLRAVIAAAQTVPGVGAGDITTGRISIQKTTRGKHTIFRAAEGISVILGQPELAGELITAAIAAGATGTSGPNFFPSDPDLAYTDALVAAFDQAQSRAAALAARAGATLGPAITIDEGAEIQYNQPASTKAEPKAPTPPVKPGTSTVTATVHVVFALQ